MTIIESITLVVLGLLALAALCLKTFVCRHHWEFYNRNEVFDPKSHSQRPIQINLISCCKKCGNYKTTKVSG